MACWEEITHATVLKYPNNPEKVFKICDEAPSDVGRNKCKTHAIGIITANYGYELNRISKICKIPQALDPNFEEECYSNIVGSMLSTVPEQLTEAMVFCSNLSETSASSCFSMIFWVSKNGLFSANNVIDICRTKLTQKVDLCLLSNSTKDKLINNN
jgi:hypothetical protein